MRTGLSIIAILSVGLAPSFAHRVDEYLQATIVAIEPDSIRLKINLTPGVDVAEKVLTQIDRDDDGVISADEAAAYADSLKHDLEVRLDDREVGLKLTASSFPGMAELRTGFGIIQLEFSASTGRLSPGPHELTLQNHHLPAISAFLINAAMPQSSAVQISAQKRTVNQDAGKIAFSFHPPETAFSKAGGLAGALAALLVLVFAGVRWKKEFLAYGTTRRSLN